MCRGAEAVAEAVAAVLGKVNACEEVNRAALLQPRIVGEEYVVNAVSRDGIHVITDVWRCYKVSTPTGTPLDEHSDLVAADDPSLGPLTDYARAVLDAVGIGWGASHAEIIVDADGPVLVEVGARLMGGTFDHNLLASAGVYSQLAGIVDAYVDPEAFARAAGRGYRPTRPARTVDLRPGVFGPIVAVNEEVLTTLPSYLTHYLAVGVGDTLADPIDRNTHVGYVNLTHPDAAQLDADYRDLRRREDDLFALQAAACASAAAGSASVQSARSDTAGRPSGA
jgi:hypothetical protein